MTQVEKIKSPEERGDLNPRPSAHRIPLPKAPIRTNLTFNFQLKQWPTVSDSASNLCTGDQINLLLSPLMPPGCIR